MVGERKREKAEWKERMEKSGREYKCKSTHTHSKWESKRESSCTHGIEIKCVGLQRGKVGEQNAQKKTEEAV